jgi:hypothetical protein
MLKNTASESAYGICHPRARPRGSGTCCRMTRWLTPANSAQMSRPPRFSNVVGPVQKSQVVAGLLRDSVVLCCALGRICNGHPASVVVENQRFTKLKISNFSVPSSFEPGGRRFESVRARLKSKVLPGRSVPIFFRCWRSRYDHTQRGRALRGRDRDARRSRVFVHVIDLRC